MAKRLVNIFGKTAISVTALLMGDKGLTQDLNPQRVQETQATATSKADETSKYFYIKEGRKIFTLPAGSYDIWEETKEGGVRKGKLILRNNLHLGQLLNEEEEKGLAELTLEAKQPKSADKKGSYECPMKVIKSDGSVYYNIKVFDKNGKFLREYQEPSDERYIRNPDFKKPRFYSTLPVLRNPDGSFDFYRPLKEGETFDDVLKEGPIDRYVPKK